MTNRKPILVSAAALAVLKFLSECDPGEARVHHWKDGGGPFEFEFIEEHGDSIEEAPPITKEAFDELIGFDCLTRVLDGGGFPREDTKGIFRINDRGRRMYENGWVPKIKMTARQKDILRFAIGGGYLIGCALNHGNSKSVAFLFDTDGNRVAEKYFNGQTFNALRMKRLIRFHGKEAKHPFSTYAHQKIRLWEVTDIARHSVGMLES